MEKLRVVAAPDDVRERMENLISKSFDELKSLIHFKLENVDRRVYNDEDSENVSVRSVPVVFNDRFDLPGDVNVVAILDLSEEEHALISDHLLSAVWHITEDELFDVCMHNLMQTELHTCSLGKLISKSFPEIADDLDLSALLDADPMFVITTKDKLYGAKALLNDKYLKSVAVGLNCGYYIIPSSIHELIVIPDRFDVTPAELTDMLHSVNEECVSIYEKLSDILMHFDLHNGLEIV